MTALKPTLDLFTPPKDLGRFYREQDQINVRYFEFNTPLKSTTKHTAWNVLGKKRIITIQGSHSGENFDGATDNLKLKDFVLEMEAWVNADIAGTQVYTDSLGIAYEVSPVDWTWRRSFDSPNRIIYTLVMMEATQNPLV